MCDDCYYVPVGNVSYLIILYLLAVVLHYSSRIRKDEGGALVPAVSLTLPGQAALGDIVVC
jgi:hypothetical protein